MIRSDSKSGGVTTVWLSVILLVLLAGPAYCDEDNTALVLNVSPVNGGTVNLAQGVHTYDRDSEVTLIAVPNPGYQFVYWLGNVSNARSSSTTVYLDSPKIVIAVFQRSKYELLAEEEGLQGSLGRGGLIASGADYAAGLEQAEGGTRPSSFRFPRPPMNLPVPKGQGNNDTPVPEGGNNDTPTPVPEPATLMFVFVGMLSLVNYKYRRAGIHHQSL